MMWVNRLTDSEEYFVSVYFCVWVSGISIQLLVENWVYVDDSVNRLVVHAILYGPDGDWFNG